MKVLIVEDDTSVSAIIVTLIKKWGHQAEQAQIGHDAVKKVSQTRFDLVLLDIFLPDTTAFELIPELKKIDPEIRIVTMTGQNTRELEAKIRQLGIAYYLGKPFPFEELKSILDHISKKQVQQQPDY